MRKGIVILSVLICAFTSVMAQDTIQGFIFYKDGSVIWQHEFASDESMEKLFNSVIENRTITEYEVFDNHLSGVMPQVSAKYELAGLKKIKVPNYILAYDCTANVLIQYKPGRYRVTLHRIRFVNNGSDYSFTNPVNLLEDYAVNKKGISKVFRRYGSHILNATFIDYFSNIRIVDNEW